MKSLIGALVLALFLFGACAPAPAQTLDSQKFGPTTSTVEEQTQLKWVPVNSPPGVEGPCYGYFITKAFGGEFYGFSGVCCMLGEKSKHAGSGFSRVLPTPNRLTSCVLIDNKRVQTFTKI